MAPNRETRRVAAKAETNGHHPSRFAATLFFEDGTSREVKHLKPLVVAEAAELTATRQGDEWQTFRLLWIAAGRPGDKGDPNKTDVDIAEWMATVEYIQWPNVSDAADPPTRSASTT